MFILCNVHQLSIRHVAMFLFQVVAHGHHALAAFTPTPQVVAVCVTVI